MNTSAPTQTTDTAVPAPASPTRNDTNNHWICPEHTLIREEHWGDGAYLLAWSGKPEDRICQHVADSFEDSFETRTSLNRWMIQLMQNRFGMVFNGVKPSVGAQLVERRPTCDGSPIQHLCNREIIQQAHALLGNELQVSAANLVDACWARGATHLVPLAEELEAQGRCEQTTLSRMTATGELLLIEDIASLLDIWVAGFEAAGYDRPLCAESAQAALRLLEGPNSKVRVIVLRPKMPTLSEHKVLSALEKIPGRSFAVIMTSGTHDVSQEGEFFLQCTNNVLAVDYLRKPFQMCELHRAAWLADECLRSGYRPAAVGDK